MSTASAELAKQQGRVPLEEAATGIDVETFLLDAKKSKKLDIDVAASITSGSITRTMAGASRLEVVVNDPHRALFKTDLLEKIIDVELDDRHFRLCQVAKNGEDITLTFEDRIVAFLKGLDKPVKIGRNKMTRAEFVRMLSRKVRQQRIDFICPQLHKKQPVKSRVPEVDRQDQRAPGLRRGVTLRIKGALADKDQLDRAETILDVGYGLGASKKVLLSALAVAIVETAIGKTTANPKYKGIFQQDPRYWPATGRTAPDAEGYFKAAMKINKEKPGLGIAELGWTTQAPGDPQYLAKLKERMKEARAILREYGEQGGDTSREVTRRYQFTVGEPDGPKGENYWEAMLRLADEVLWRVFVVGRKLYYVSDKDLMKSKPRARIQEDDEGIDSIDFDWDTGKRNNEATVQCRASRWFAPPGTVIALEKMGPATGRWLVWEITRDLFSDDCTIILRKAQKPRKEPKADVISRARREGDDVTVIGGSVVTGEDMRERIKNAALACVANDEKYFYRRSRPYPRSLFMPGIIYTDCSGFAILCYKAAGAPDPNGTGYDGSGNTESLRPRGKKVGRPEVGDLVHYSGHVAIFIGDGKVASFGSEPGPRVLNVHYRNDILGYYRYDLTKPRVEGTPRPPLTPGANGENRPT